MKAVLLCILLSITLCHEVPQDDLQLVNGFIAGSGVINKLQVANCTSEFGDLLNASLNIADSYIEKDYVSIASYTLKLYSAYSKVVVKCDQFKPSVDQLMAFSYTVYENPQAFLDNVLDNMVSFTIIKQYYELRTNVKNGKFYDAGVAFGTIFKTMVGEKAKDINYLGFLDNILTK
jgi:hypothetical protein